MAGDFLSQSEVDALLKGVGHVSDEVDFAILDKYLTPEPLYVVVAESDAALEYLKTIANAYRAEGHRKFLITEQILLMLKLKFRNEY